LSENGVRDVRILALHLKNMDVRLEKVYHSGKLRAEQSARLVTESVSPDIEPLQRDGLNPNDDPAPVASDIEQMSETILIASHMPFVSRLCSVLLTGAAEAQFASTPGTLFCLERADGNWRLAYMLRPDFL